MVAIRKPYHNPNDLFKNKTSTQLIKLHMKYGQTKNQRALIMDSSLERTGKLLINNNFTKDNIHCVEREKYQRRKYSTIIRDDFTNWVKVSYDKQNYYNLIFADYEGNTHVTKDNICKFLPYIIAKKGGIIALTVAKRQPKGQTFVKLAKNISKDLRISAKKNKMKIKKLLMIDSKGCGRGRGAGMATFYYLFSQVTNK